MILHTNPGEEGRAVCQIVSEFLRTYDITVGTQVDGCMPSYLIQDGLSVATGVQGILRYLSQRFGPPPPHLVNNRIFAADRST